MIDEPARAGRRYTEWQMEEFRKELRRLFGKKKRNSKNYNWFDLQGEIEESVLTLTDKRRRSLPERCRDVQPFRFGGDRLRQFVVGTRNRKTKKHYYTRLKDDDRLQGIEVYLNDPDTEGSQLLHDGLDEVEHFAVPRQWIEFIYSGKVVSPRISGTSLAGVFRSFGDRAEPLRLSLEHAPDDRFLVVSAETLVPPEKVGLLPLESYSGWIVLSPDGFGILTLKNKRTSEAQLFVMSSIDASVYLDSKEPVAASFLKLIRCGSPIGSDRMDSEVGGHELPIRWITEYQRDALTLVRESEKT